MGDSNISSDITGRKVFFLFPTAYVQNQVITELIQHEYEVYISKDARHLAQALKKYTDSVVFVNIDEGMPEPEWEKWVHTLMTALPDLKVGVFSSTPDEKIRDKYLDTLHVKCGYYNSKLDMSKTTAKILEVLDEMNVKGRRKYLRANTQSESVATINMPVGGGFINGAIRDVSVVGVSCTFEEEMTMLRKNTLLKDIQIRLQTMLLKVEAVVFGSRLDGHEKVFVLLFTQRVDPEVKVKIRKYIQQSLQHKMDREIN
ncbi:MAG: pilus assembly protein PilZ [Treponema sp.]|jgi:hypothetical protein|nr:pilus assembly protein PilZ [Treponema sp.]